MDVNVLRGMWAWGFWVKSRSSTLSILEDPDKTFLTQSFPITLISLFYIHRTSRLVLQTKPIEKRATILARDNVSLDATKLIKIMQAPEQRVVPPS